MNVESKITNKIELPSMTKAELHILSSLCQLGDVDSFIEYARSNKDYILKELCKKLEVE